MAGRRGKAKNPDEGAWPDLTEVFELKHVADVWKEDSMICGYCKEEFPRLHGFFHDHCKKVWYPTGAKTIADSPVGAIIKRTESESFPLYYCVLHPDVKHFYLESIEHHIKFTEPERHMDALRDKEFGQESLAAAPLRADSDIVSSARIT